MGFDKEFDMIMATFKKEIFDAFEEEFSEIVKPAMIDAVEEVVYNRYEPKKYIDRRRTREGGLQNEKSITPEFERKDKEIVATVKNKATWRNEKNRTDSLDSAIVEGTMFPKTHVNYKKLKRPFYDDPKYGVIKQVQNSEKELEKRIKQKMINNGWGVK